MINECHCIKEVDVVEGPIERVARQEIVKAIRKMNLGINMEMVTASNKIEIKVKMEFCQSVLNGGRMPIDWKMNV